MHRSLLLTAVLAVALSTTAGANPGDCLRSGPMLGYSEIQATVVWLQTDRPCRVQLRYWPEEEPDASRLSTEIVTSPEGDHIARFPLDGLSFGTRYHYEVYLDGERLAHHGGESFAFTTQPMWRWRTDPPPFRAALGSCAYLNDTPFDRPGKPYGGETQIFDVIADNSPDFMLWLGDNIYYREADWLTEAGMRARFAHNRAHPDLARLLSTTHHYALWDDHDYGPDNSDRTFRLRKEALEIHRDYWGNPPMGTVETPGAFTRFEWGDVEFFLLDGRFHRAPNQLPPGPGKHLFGADQMRWLKESLLSSKATFKFVASGSQMINPYVHSPRWQELWTLYPEERDAFLDFLAKHRLGGVVFLSGDRHYTELLRLERAGSYPLYELTSSPLTAGTSSAERDLHNPHRVPGTLVAGQRNFALMEVDGPADDRVLTFRVLSNGGEELWRHRILRSELEPPALESP